MIPGSANPLLLQSADYRIEKSLRFNAADAAFLTRTPSATGNRKTWTWSAWMKVCLELESIQSLIIARSSDANRTGLFWRRNDYYLETFWNGTRLTADTRLVDPSAWYHIVWSVDTTQASNNSKLYVNNNLIQQRTLPQDSLGLINAAGLVHSIGRDGNLTDYHFSGYLADVQFVDGQALEPGSFGYTDARGAWQAKKYNGTYGTNGYHLDFADNSTVAAIGTDATGNGNNWTPQNFSVTDNTPASYTTTNTSTARNAFNGNLFNYWQANANSASLLTFTQAITGTTFRIYMLAQYATNNFRINGTLPAGFTTAQPLGWYDFSSHINGALTSLQIGYVPATYSQVIYAIEVDGKLLRDSDIIADSLIDSPTSYGIDPGGTTGGVVRGNYATLNPLDGSPSGLSNGNLDATNANAYPTIIPGSGLWYYEVNGVGIIWDGTRANWTPRAGSHNFGQRPWRTPAPANCKALCTTNLPDPQTVTTSGTYTGNGLSDGPFVYLNGVPTEMTINGNAVTLGTQADKLSHGFKVRTTNTAYNQNAVVYSYSITSTGHPFKRARAQTNP